MGFTVWQRAGVMLVNIDHDSAKKAKLWHDNGFRCVFPQTHVGINSRHKPETVNAYLEPFRKLGYSIGHWGFLTGVPSPKAEAECASYWDTQIKSDFYVPNAEIQYKYTGGDGHDQCGPCFARSKEFCVAYHALQPKKQVGISSYSRFDYADIDWSSWLGILNARALPQAYVNEVGPFGSPKNAYRGAQDVRQPHNVMRHPKTKKVITGFPKSYIHVTIAKPDPDDAYPMTIDDWIELLVEAKEEGHPLGFTIYEGENFTDADVKELGKAIRDYELAAI